MLILGGTGNTGRKIAELLLRHTDVKLLLASRNVEKLSAITQSLQDKYSPDRVDWVQVNASDPASLKIALTGINFLISAASTAKFTKLVARACLDSSCDYLDVQYSQSKVKILRSMADEIESKGRCFISDAGFHPGLPAALVRYGAYFFDQMETAIVGSAINQDWRNLDLSPSTQREFVREMMNYQSLFYRNGTWQKASLWTTKDFIKMDYGDKFKRRLCAPMFFEEMRILPEAYPSLDRTGFYISGFGWFTDMIIIPIVMLSLKLFPRPAEIPMSKLVLWSLEQFSRPPYGVVMKLEASGYKGNRPEMVDVRLFHKDGYWFTAIPVAACLLQYLQGAICKPGLHLMGNLVNPTRLVNDMKMMGIRITENSRE